MARPLPAPAGNRALPSPLPRAQGTKEAKPAAAANPSGPALKWSPESIADIQKLAAGGATSNDAKLLALLQAPSPDRGLSIVFSLLQHDPPTNAAAIFANPKLSEVLLKLAQVPNTAALGLIVNILTQEPAHAHFLARSGARQLLAVVSQSPPQPAAVDLALKALQNLLAMQPPGMFLTPEDLNLLVRVAAPAQLSGNAAARTAFLCLNYLAANSHHRPHMRDAGIVPVLIRVMSSATAGPLRVEALQALASMSRIELRSVDLSTAMFDAVFAAMDAPDPTLQAHSCAVIANLSSWDNCESLLQACLQRPQAATRLLRLCESALPTVHTPALLAASNLLSHEATHTWFLYAHCASLLLALVEGPPTAREGALTALVHLSLFFEEGRNAIHAAGGVATLNRIIRDPHATLEVKDEALKALLNMSQHDDAEAAILTQGMISPLVGFMAPQTTPIQQELAVLTLSNLSLSPDGRLAIGAAGGLKAAAQLLHAEENTDVQIQSACSELLSRLALSGANRLAFRLEGGMAVANAAAQKSKNETVRQSVAAALHRLQLPAETEEDIDEESPKPVPKKAATTTPTTMSPTQKPAPRVASPPKEVVPRVLPTQPVAKPAAVAPANAAPAPQPRMTRSVTSPTPMVMRGSAPGNVQTVQKGTTRRRPIGPMNEPPPEPADILPPRPQRNPNPNPNPVRAAASPSPAVPSLANPAPPQSPLPPLSDPSSYAPLNVSPPASPTSASSAPRKALPKPPPQRKNTTGSLPQGEVDLSLNKESYAVPDEPEVKKEHSGRFRPVLDFLRKLGSPAVAISRLRRPTTSNTGTTRTAALTRSASSTTLSRASSPGSSGSGAWAASSKPPSPRDDKGSPPPPQAPLGATVSSPALSASLPPRPVVPLNNKNSPASMPNVTVVAALPPRPSPSTDSVTPQSPAPPTLAVAVAGRDADSPARRRKDSTSPRHLPVIVTTNMTPRVPVSISSRETSPRVPQQPSPLSASSPVLGNAEADVIAPSASVPDPKDPAAIHKKRTHIAQELLETEGAYCRNLTVIIKKFYGPLNQVAKSRKPFITQEQVRAIFSNVEIIFSYHTLLLEALNGRMRRWSPRQRLGDVFLQLGEFLKVYTTYVNNYDTSVRVLGEALAASTRLAAFLANVSKQPACNKLDLPSFLIMPVQRVPRYSLLLRDLLKNTEKDHPDHESLSKALTQIDRVAVTLNTRKTEAEHQSTITELARRLAGDAPLLKELVHPARRFIREGDAKFQESTSTAGGKHDGLLFLFNDAVLFADTPLTGRPRARALVHFSCVLGCSATEKRKLVIATTTSSIWTVTLATGEIRDTWVTDVHEAWLNFKARPHS